MRWVMRCSRMYFFYSILASLFAAACIFFTFSGLACVGFLFFIAASYIHAQRKNKIVAIEYVEGNHWKLYAYSSEVQHAMLSSTSVMWCHLMILHFSMSDSREQKNVVIFYDSLSREDYCALRRCIRQ